ncbi:alpha/beta fold hydrolase [Mycolicibacterium hodleri]|uniref:alpha/beta fold hydrolase n=1 Tax=Mycolicibacterium hodleri TaxID=49897 RepID=UPI0021F25948|nr:alpha/beta hydrolase [Mycolicibacterium hodleri]
MTSTFDEIDVSVAGGSLTVRRRCGNGPTLLFLHYWGGSGRTWDPMLTHLDPQTPVATYDQRGWSRSKTLPGPFDLAQLARDATAVVAALGTDVVLVGHSMGGKVAQLVAAQRPAALAGLILVAPAPPDPPAAVTPQYRRELAHAYDGPEAVTFALDHVLSANPLTGSVRTAALEDSLSAATTAARTEWPLRGIAEDVTTAARRISVDTVVVAGERDVVEPVDVLRRHLLPFIPRARLRVLDAVGHLIPLEAPSALAEQLTRARAELTLERSTSCTPRS